MKLIKRVTLISTILMLSTSVLYAKSTLAPADINDLATIANIDKSEIILSAVAINKKANSDVTGFAKMMINMHGDNLTQILQMANNLHAMPLTGNDAEKIHAQSIQQLDKLGGLEGDQFSKAYIDAMVKGHTAALKLIDDHLMKTAQNDDVKKFLTDTRAVVVQHLEAAKKIQQSMQS